jgi:hypothetical protein
LVPTPRTCSTILFSNSVEEKIKKRKKSDIFACLR